MHKDVHCPIDQSLLTRKQLKHGMYWECPDCEGRSVGVALLKRAVEPKTIQRLWHIAYQEGGIQSHQCAHCQQSMRHVSQDNNGQLIQLDVCRICQVLWYQPDQFQTLPAHTDLEDLPSLPQADYVPGAGMPLSRGVYDNFDMGTYITADITANVGLGLLFDVLGGL